MSKFIFILFILFILFCSQQSFSQKGIEEPKMNNKDISCQINILEKEMIETAKVQKTIDKEIVLIYKGNLCDVITIKVSDLLNESMLKKLLANV